jgi:2-dehydropantoate 2-reductase
MRFIVLGAGVIGCYVGGRLAAAGQAVTLVGRPRLTEAMALQGLTVSDLDGYRAHVAPQQLRLANSLAAGWPAAPDTEPTVVLLCVKGGATASAARELAACCPAGTVVLSLQNGVENVARIKAEAPQLVALAGMVPYNVVMPGPTQVHRATTGTLRLARHPVTEAMLPLMAAAGLPTALSDDMRAVQWGKLLLNLNNPINALSGLPLREQLLQRDYRRVLATLQAEALAALDAAGITPAQVASAAPRVLPHILRLPDWLFTRVAARLLRIDASARSSMWDDLQQGRGTEIDDLSGAVVRLAACHGVTAPRNAAITGLVMAHRAGQRWTGAALRQWLLATTTTERHP